MKSVFINEAFEKAINDYLKSKNQKESILYNSFLVVVIRILINIYGELDIINPYHIKNENIFDNNLLKFGAKKEDIDNLKRLFDGFYIINNRNDNAIRKEENVYFIEVQKLLIDLYNIKRINYGTTKSEMEEFYDLLYTPNTKNPLRLSYNYLNAIDVYEIDNYYKTSLINKNKQNELVINEIKVDLPEDDNLNLVRQDKLITTGNGYVDILIIMSIIVTVVMVVAIFTSFII